MELRAYIRILSKRIWLILLLPLFAAVVSAFVSICLLHPVYGSAATLFVVDQSKDLQRPVGYEEIMASDMLVKDCRELVKSRTVTETVIAKLGLEGMKPSDLAKKISINLKKDTRVLEITAYADSPQLAMMIANATVEIFTKEVVDIMKVEVIHVIDGAELPDKPVRPQPLLNVVIALVAGLVLAVSGTLIAEFMDDTVKDSEDVERHMGLSILGVIPSLNIE